MKSEYPSSRLARIACRMINMINHQRIFADFAICNEVADSSFPPLIERRTDVAKGVFSETGICGYCCSRKASLICGVCFSAHCATFYCSQEHQSKDWARHKFECKPLPKLISPDEAQDIVEEENEPKRKEKFSVPHVEVFKEGDRVKVTFVQNERVLYVRPTNKDFEKLMETVRNAAKEAGKLTKKPEQNDTVLAKFRGEFCRAHVLDVFDPDESGNDLQCLLLDFGVLEKFKWTDLKKCTYKLRGLHRQTFKTILEDVSIQNKKEAQKFLQQLHENGEELEVVRVRSHNNDHYVVLKHGDEVINDRIRGFDAMTETEGKLFFHVSS
jgi:hypothetical protein